MNHTNRRDFVRNLTLGAAGATIAGRFASAASAKPNIVVILADDQGYADVSFNPLHPKEVSTPNIDALAASGVRLTNGYASGHVCSPTRAGLMTGRYQQRFGIYTAGQGGSGVPLTEIMMPAYLAKAGYKSGMFGKWHQGLEPPYNPVNRGFDEFYGFMGRGGHDYFDLKSSAMGSPIQRGLDPIDDEGYLTTRITEESTDFIKRHKDGPFFAYVCYNAVHAPPQAPKEDIARYNTGDPARDILMAMLYHLDIGVGRIIQTLKDEGVYDNTLVFYLSDNGGAKTMMANNAPLRGFKQEDYEGGVRVPFLVSWPDRLKAGKKCDVPVISFDIMPTALAAAGIKQPTDKSHLLDGKNILPAIEGKTKKVHDFLCWNSADGKWAIRQGDWKLVGVKAQTELFNLKNDLGEKTNQFDKHPERVAQLMKTYNTWLDEMAEPIKGGFKRWDPKAVKAPAPPNKNKAAKLKAREEAKAKRDAEKK